MQRNLLAGAVIATVYTRWSGGFPWDVALASQMTTSEILPAAVVWLDLPRW